MSDLIFSAVFAALTSILILPLIVSFIYEENLYLSYLVPIALTFGIGFLLTRLKLIHRDFFVKDSGFTDIFIYPGFEFKGIDMLITNFHLPESTLLMLVSALCGKENILNAYKIAVENKYRFFSFGDAMFIKE